jgi:hypothetical protein
MATMTKKRATLAAIIVALCLNALLLAVSPGLALPYNLANYVFGPKLVRVEAVMQEAGASRDYRIDRGRLRGGGAGSITLLELDGSTQSIAVDPSAQVELDGRAATFAQLRRGMRVLVVRIDDAPATIVQAESRR